jgi:hypothetical protein
MKKIIMSFVTALLLLIMIPAHANEKILERPTASSSVSTTEVELVKRVNEIKALDKSSLTASEKKELRSELRAIKKEVNRIDGGVYYISGGLILLIILLIILL